MKKLPNTLGRVKTVNKKLLGLKFKKDHFLGSHLVDFAKLKKKLTIELDGEIHDNLVLRNMRSQVLGFDNELIIEEFDEVAAKIKRTLLKN